MRHRDFTRLARCRGCAAGIKGFNDDVLGRDVHAAGFALMGDKAGVPSAVAVGNRAAKHGANRVPLMRIEILRGHKGHLDTQVVQTNPAALRVPRDMGNRIGVAENHAWPGPSNRPKVAIQVGVVHVESGQQGAAHELVTQLAQAVLGAEFDRRAPHHQFGISNVDAEPACCAPLGRHIVADALSANEEGQRFTG